MITVEIEVALNCAEVGLEISPFVISIPLCSLRSRNMQEARVKDGIHWNTTAVRNMAYMFINHVAGVLHSDLKPSPDYAVPIKPELCSMHDTIR